MSRFGRAAGGLGADSERQRPRGRTDPVRAKGGRGADSPDGQRPKSGRGADSRTESGLRAGRQRKQNEHRAYPGRTAGGFLRSAPRRAGAGQRTDFERTRLRVRTGPGADRCRTAAGSIPDFERTKSRLGVLDTGFGADSESFKSGRGIMCSQN